MREIKFKIWDKTRNKWLFSNCGKFLLTQEGKAMFHMDGDNPLEPIIDQIEYEVLFYTGLKDKNGKEIYEGDIIKNNFAETIGSIMFADCGYWIKTINKDIFDNTIYHVLGQYDGEVLEIIGNIYENPELLEEGE